jgi:hypothetical protein
MKEWKADAVREELEWLPRPRRLVIHTDVGEVQVGIIVKTMQRSIYIASMRFIHNLSEIISGSLNTIEIMSKYLKTEHSIQIA